MHLFLFLAALFTVGNAYEAQCGQMTNNVCSRDWNHWDTIRAVDEADCIEGCREFAAEHGDQGCCEWEHGKNGNHCSYNFRTGKGGNGYGMRKATLCTTSAYPDRTQVDVVCAKKYYLKGYDGVPKRETCQQRCDERSECHTFCHSNNNPEWDCLLYTNCDEVQDYFLHSGNWADTYECFEKPGAEAASMMTAVTQPEAVDQLMVKIFAVVGLLFVVFFLFRHFVTSKSMTPVPSEVTPLEIETNEL